MSSRHGCAQGRHFDCGLKAAGKVVMESVIETKASRTRQFIEGLRGDLRVVFEEGTSAAWLYDLLKPPVAKLVVCRPAKRQIHARGQPERQDLRLSTYNGGNKKRRGDLTKLFNV